MRTPVETRRLSLPLALALAMAAGCAASRVGSGAATTQAVSAAPVAQDWSLDLAARLPRGADQCAVVRPTQLPADARGLYGALSQASAISELVELELLGYAEARREGRSGPGRRVILLRTPLGPERVRELLDRDAPFALRWVSSDASAESCRAADCPALVRVEPDGALRIELGAWPADLRPGAEARCLEHAAQEPRALEVAVRRGVVRNESAPLALPLRSLSVVRPAKGGVLVERVDRLPSEDLARLLAQPDLELDWLPEAETRIGTELSRVQEGPELRTRVQVLWDDLALAAEDRERRARAERYATLLGQLVPEAALRLEDAEQVLRQADLLKGLYESSGAEPPVEWLRRRRVLLERAVAQHPDDPRFARALAALPQ